MHWKDKSKSSYNFYLKEGQYIKGMRTFTIHKPGVRNYIHEWIYHEMIGDMGLIKSNYDFFHLYINGDNQGLYALEEKMSKEIIERNKRRNGPIFTGVNFISNRDKGIDAGIAAADEEPGAGIIDETPTPTETYRLSRSDQRAASGRRRPTEHRT